MSKTGLFHNQNPKGLSLQRVRFSIFVLLLTRFSFLIHHQTSLPQEILFPAPTKDRARFHGFDSILGYSNCIDFLGELSI